MDENALIDAFGILNIANKKSISKAKLSKALHQLNLDCSPEEVDALFKHSNLLDEGRNLTFIEFKLAVLKAALSEVRLQRTFNEIDKASSGFIDYKQLSAFHSYSPVTVPGNADISLTKEFIKCDTNRDGRIDFGDFERLIFRLTLGHQNIKDLFNRFDKNKDGHIDKAEFYRALWMLGSDPSLEEALILLKDTDIDRDGRISYEEFELFLLRVMRGDPKLKIKQDIQNLSKASKKKTSCS